MFDRAYEILHLELLYMIDFWYIYPILIVGLLVYHRLKYKGAKR